MTFGILEVSVIALATAAVFLLIFNILSIHRELWRDRQSTSRFPLFACRDQLVMLIAQEQMEQDDEVWQRTYAGVNMLLRTTTKLHVLDLLGRFIRHRVKIESDPKFKRSMERLKQKTTVTEKDVPEFSEVSSAISKAVVHLAGRRTTALHFTVVALLFVAVLTAKALIIDGPKAAKATIEAVGRAHQFRSKPSTGELLSFSKSAC